MTTQQFDTTAHPRSTSDGRFVESAHSAPEGTLAAVGPRAPHVQAAIDAVTGGRAALERRHAAGTYHYGTFAADRQQVWRDAGGPACPAGALDAHLNTGSTTPDPDEVERGLEVTYHRARSGRYSAGTANEVHVTPVAEHSLRWADSEAIGRGEYVTEAWNEGRTVGAEGEIQASTARLFAEHALQNLPNGHRLVDYPRLAEMASSPYSEHSGATPAKADDFRAELHAIREAGYLSGPRHRRLDTLATFAMYGDASTPADH